MKQYRHIFFDLDHTLWDFETNAYQTLQHLYYELELQKLGVDDFKKMHTHYIYYNDKLWDRYRKGYITQQDLRLKRMWLTLLEFKIANEPLAKKMNELFLEQLPNRTALFPYTIELLNYLKNKNYPLHIITNGFEEVQQRKLQYSGLQPYFQKIITSESSNSLKPKKEIFEYALQKTGADAATSLMIGDNIEVDIEGARNAGIDQVWVNHIQEQTQALPTYTVTHLKEIEKIL